MNQPKRWRIQRWIVLGLFAALACAAPVLADDGFVAEIANVNGSVWCYRQDAGRQMHVGEGLLPGDVIETGEAASVGLVFADDTRVSLGPGSKLKIQEYRFAPSNSQLACVLELFRGTAVYVSGIIAKLSTTASRFITPTASIGIRGTKFAVQVEES